MRALKVIQRSFKKKDRDDSIFSILTTTGLISALVFLDLLPLVLIPIPIVILVLTNLISLSHYSTFKICHEYMICNTPLYFWQYKKLFYYRKLKGIMIRKGSGFGNAHTMTVCMLSGQLFQYSLDPDLLEDFVDTMKPLGVKIKIVL